MACAPKNAENVKIVFLLLGPYYICQHKHYQQQTLLAVVFGLELQK